MDVYDEIANEIAHQRHEIKKRIGSSDNPKMLVERLQGVRTEVQELLQEVNELISKNQGEKHE